MKEKNINIIRNVKQAIKVYFKQILNRLQREETIVESKNKWRNLAKKNARYYVLSTFGENITEEQFTHSGEEDYEKLIKNDSFVKELQPLKNKRILEIGCGTGRITQCMTRDFMEVYAVDIADEMIESSKRRLVNETNVHLFVTDGLHLPFSEDFFDIVFSFIVFQHMPDKKTIRKNVEDVVRVLKVGGLAKIQVRGEPVVKGNWFYGPAFSKNEIEILLSGLSIQLLKTEGEGERYYWLWFKKL